MVNVRKGGNDRIIVGDQRKVGVQLKGELTLEKDDENKVVLKNVRVVESISKNIISIGSLLKDGGEVVGDYKGMTVTTPEATIYFNRNKQDGLYYAKLRRVKNEDEHCNLIENENEWTQVTSKERRKWRKMSREDAHAMWGHPHLDQLNKMA